MRLTIFSDYTLRTLMYLALHPDRFVTIAEIAGAYGISPNHLMKVAQELTASGAITSLRGQRGGLRLARPAGEIHVGDVVRRAERGRPLLPCDECTIKPGCLLPNILDQAMAAFLGVLDAYSVADLIANRTTLMPLLHHDRPAPAPQSEPPKSEPPMPCRAESFMPPLTQVFA